MATNEQLRLVIDVAAKQAVRELNTLTKATQDAAGAQDDLRTNAERVNDGLKAASAVLLADMQQSEAAAKALGDALGPEMAQKIGSAKLDSFIGDLKRAGLTFEEVTQNADMFAATLRDMDGAAARVDNVDRAVSRLGHDSDQSRSVLANMVGNSVQDLGQLGGVAGSAGVMIGQLGEYAVDGNIKLGQLAGMAVPMAAVTLAVKGISDHMEKVAKIDAFRQGQIDGYTNALKGAESELAGIVDHLNEVGSISLTTSIGIHNVTEQTTELGLSTRDAAELIKGGKDQIQAWGDALVAGGADAEKVKVVSLALAQNVDDLSVSQKNAAITAKFLADNVSISGSMMGEAARQGHALADAIHRVNLEGLMTGSINGSMAGEAARNGGRQIDMYAKYIAEQAKKGGGAAKAAVKEVAKKTAEELAREMDQLNANKFEFGGMSEAAYRKYLNGRLDALKKYSDDWVAIRRKLDALDDAADKRKKAAAEEKKRLEDEAKRAAEDRKRAEEEARQAELDQAANRSIAAANVAGATYQYITTAADPYAVINAIKQWERNNGTGWRS